MSSVRSMRRVDMNVRAGIEHVAHECRRGGRAGCINNVCHDGR
jgi:hypothetical protein